MVKKSILSVAVILGLLFIVQSANAQLINYDRRNRYTNVSENQSTNTQQIALAETPVLQRVSNRTERIYDANRDGRLQDSEINEFYRDVISAVNKKGKFVVSSSLLSKFDRNDDGKISRYEVRAISKHLKK